MRHRYRGVRHCGKPKRSIGEKMRNFMRWYWIDSPSGFLTVVLGVFLLFTLGIIFQPEKCFTETSGHEYGYLEDWLEEPELKDDIESAWADKFVSQKEYERILHKHSRLSDIRKKAKFRQTMTAAENLNFDDITMKGTDRD